MTEQEKTLIAGCVNGNKAAWDELVRQYSNLIYHTIKTTASVRRAEAAQDFVDDLFQEVFLSLVKDDFFAIAPFSRRSRLYAVELAQTDCRAPDHRSTAQNKQAS